MLSLVLLAALAAEPGGQAGSWIWTKRLNGSVGYVWGYKDEKGFVHSLVGKPRPGDPEINYGIARDKFEHIPVGGEWFGGNVKARHAPIVVGATGQPPKRVHLTIIGPESQRKAALADLDKCAAFKELEKELGDGLAVQSYDPSDPMVADIKLPDGGNPDIVIQSESGKVKFRAHDYPGSERIIQEIRKADPRYDPKKDPNGQDVGLDSLLASLPPLDEKTATFIALGIIVFAYLMKGK